jgi:polyisoprenoid-binding protein YceI
MAATHSVIFSEPFNIMKRVQFICSLIIVFLLAVRMFAQAAPAPPPAQEFQLQLDPAQSRADILLTGNFHTVDGSFTLKHGSLQYDPATGKTSGEIVFDATSGKTGNDGRDRKMHKDVLESARFPEISFRPDHAEGALAASGDSTLQVHGIFSIHGGDHELTIPVTVHIEGGTWTAKAAFQVPYAKWGMKNPSVLFLRVESVVGVQMLAGGSIQ